MCINLLPYRLEYEVCRYINRIIRSNSKICRFMRPYDMLRYMEKVDGICIDGQWLVEYQFIGVPSFGFG